MKENEKIEYIEPQTRFVEFESDSTILAGSGQGDGWGSDDEG